MSRLYSGPTDFSAKKPVEVSKKENDYKRPAYMKILLNSDQIHTTVEALFNQIIADISPNSDLAIIGLRSRGEILAQRLNRKLNEQLGRGIPCGTLDITLYRDDIHSPRSGVQPTVRATEIAFDVNDKFILLVDDVLHTGRSVSGDGRPDGFGPAPPCGWRCWSIAATGSCRFGRLCRPPRRRAE